MSKLVQLKPRDLASDQEVRWCPGCGDYGIIKAVQKALAGLNVPRENMVIVSGIGCASRFPYYMSTYGFHGIHGRAPALATGAKLANPDLSVWAIGGDGDLMSIGGNHLIHVLRRNVDITVLLFNNRIYGLTKGQFSPTTGLGVVTKTSPMGSIDPPFDPMALALGAGATFAARSVDRWTPHLTEIIAAAHAHKGAAFVEILQNCIIFNDGAFEAALGKGVRDDKTIKLRHGDPAIFGKDGNKGIVLDGMGLRAVELGDQYSEADVLRYDETNRGLASMMASMEFPQMPMPMGILRRVEAPSYNDALDAQIGLAREKRGEPSLDDLFRAGDTWTVTE